MKPIVEIDRGQKTSKMFGKMSRITFPDKSKIYITKLGWTLVTPKGIEIRIPFSEINVAIRETLKQGYVIKEKKV